MVSCDGYVQWPIWMHMPGACFRQPVDSARECHAMLLQPLSHRLHCRRGSTPMRIHPLYDSLCGSTPYADPTPIRLLMRIHSLCGSIPCADPYADPLPVRILCGSTPCADPSPMWIYHSCGSIPYVDRLSVARLLHLHHGPRAPRQRRWPHPRQRRWADDTSCLPTRRSQPRPL